MADGFSGCALDPVCSAAATIKWHTIVEPMLLTFSLAAPFILIVGLMVYAVVRGVINRRKREHSIRVIKGIEW